MWPLGTVVAAYLPESGTCATLERRPALLLTNRSGLFPNAAAGCTLPARHAQETRSRLRSTRVVVHAGERRSVSDGHALQASPGRRPTRRRGDRFDSGP